MTIIQRNNLQCGMVFVSKLTQLCILLIVFFGLDGEGFLFCMDAHADVTVGSGYPRAMDFRHLRTNEVGSYEQFERYTVLLADLTRDDSNVIQPDKLAEALAFKAAHSNACVLVQLNNEAMGLSGTTYTVPAEEAALLGLDTNYVPSTSFKGHWLYRVGSLISQDINNSSATLTVPVDDASKFIFPGTTNYPAAVLYQKLGGVTPNWDHSEYVTITGVNTNLNTVSFERWPGTVWYNYLADRVYLAASAGDIYSCNRYWLYPNTKLFRTFAPNLTQFCPTNSSGRNAVSWYAGFFTNLWNTEVAPYTPVLDGIEIDANAFDGGYVVYSHKGLIDCNNDGVADDCQFGGINYWGLGVHKFLCLLREGLGDDALILIDDSGYAGNRSYSVVNGSENENFHSTGEMFSQQLNTYLLWSQVRASYPGPAWSYLQMIGNALPVYSNNSPVNLTLSEVRVGMASAMMGDGVFTYRTGGFDDRDAMYYTSPTTNYWWDEYFAGAKCKMNWLGHPRGGPVMTKLLGGANRLPASDFSNGLAGTWTLLTYPGYVATGPAVVTDPGNGNVLKVTVSQLNMINAPAGAIVLKNTCVSDVVQGNEYVLSFWLRSDNVYSNIDASYSGLGLGFTVGIKVNEVYYPTNLYRLQSCPEGFRYYLTFHAPATGTPEVQFRFGSELGRYYLDDIRLESGCAEVMYRVFDNGMVLMNGSTNGGFTFNLDTYTNDTDGVIVKYKRLTHSSGRDAWPNSGQDAEGTLGLTKEDAIFLIKRNEFLFDTNDNAEGWYGQNGIAYSLPVTNGCLNYSAVSTGFIRTGSLSAKKIDCNVFDQLKIRLKNQTGSTTGVCYFVAGTNTMWSGKTFSIGGSPDYTEYSLDMSTHAAWYGELRYLRLDILGGSGPVSIDSIKIE